MAAEKFGDFFVNLINSGKAKSPDETLRYSILNIAVFAGGVLLIVFGISASLAGNISRGISDFIMSGLCFITIILLRTKLPLLLPGGVTLGAFGIMCAMFVFTGELGGFASLWVFSFPLLSIFILGLKMGLIYSILVFCSVIALTLVPGLADGGYSIDVATRLIGVYFLITLLAVIYEQSRLVKDRRVNQLNNELRVERDSIRDLVCVIKSKVHALSNTGYELTVNMSKTSVVVDNIAANFEGIKDLDAKQKEKSVEVNKAMGNIKISIDIQIKLIDEQADSVNTSSSAIEEMTANIHSVSQTLAENSKNVETLTEASERGRTALQTVAQEIQEIARESEGLLEINSVMNTIASQTNLLSMNAAIEAAHAGETGKGFAVVADEIRKLAESSSKQSKTTATMLKKIKASIDSITKSSDEVLARFGAIDSGVRTVSEHELNIRHAMEEQETGGKQILEAIGRLREITVSVQKGSEDMSRSGSDLIRETDEFIKISNEAMIGMSDIVNGALREIKTAVTHVNEMSEENNKNFEELKAEAGKFKTSTGGEKRKILAIDDDEIQLTMINAFLKENYDVVTAKSCREALKFLYQGLDPSYILLDLMMPQTDGWVTYERIHGISSLHNVPIAFLTSSGDPADIRRAKEMGAVDYIKKPCSKGDLLGRLQMALR